MASVDAASGWPLAEVAERGGEGGLFGAQIGANTSLSLPTTTFFYRPGVSYAFPLTPM